MRVGVFLSRVVFSGVRPALPRDTSAPGGDEGKVYVWTNTPDRVTPTPTAATATSADYY